MEPQGHQWLTIHLARFATAKAPGELDHTGPDTAAAWRVGPDGQTGADGMRSPTSDIWGGLGFYHRKDDAAAAMPTRSTPIAMSSGAQESWHAMLAVVTHRGDLDLSTMNAPHPRLVPSGETMTGPIAVMTSAGYTDYDTDDLPRHRAFLAGVEKVREYYAGLPGNLLRQIINPLMTPNGCTISVWADSAQMVRAAYKNGVHKDMLDRHKAAPFVDRTSFTRLAILQTSGTWNGHQVPGET